MDRTAPNVAIFLLAARPAGARRRGPLRFPASAAGSARTRRHPAQTAVRDCRAEGLANAHTS